MGKLKPIGSEKLNGMEKINRMLEIARYKENIPSNINEDKSVEYSRTLPNGSRYQIVKEKNVQEDIIVNLVHVFQNTLYVMII